MPIKTATLDDFTIDRIQIMAYGAPGAGKTYFIQFLPECFVFNIDQGLKTLARLPDKPKGLHFMPAEGAPPLTYDQIMLIVAQIAANPRAFGKTIVLDNLSALEQQLLTEEAKRAGRKDHIPEQNEYRPVHAKLHALLLALKQLPMHLYVTLGEIADKESRTGDLQHILPDLSRRNQAVFPRMFDEVYYFKQSGPKDYEILTSGDGIAYAKSRLRIPSGLSHKGVAEAVLKLVTPRPEDSNVIPLRKEEGA